MYTLKVFLGLVCLILVSSPQLFASHGVTIHGDLKYSSDFEYFDYVNGSAPKGGDLVLHDIGSFDKLNPFTIKGEAPYRFEYLVYEPLAVPSLDEPSSSYGLLAKSIEVAEDKMSVTFVIDERAKFSDGKAVTAADVAFTFDYLTSDKAHPLYSFYYQDISGYKIAGENEIKFIFTQPNRELPLIAAQMRILPAHKKDGFTGQQGEMGSMVLSAIGSGPYVVSEVNVGKTITYTRNNEYWASDHPCRRGLYNFDSITVKYFKDQTVALEAFKAGEFDFLSVNIAKQWARDMGGKKFESGELLKKTYPHSNNSGLQGFVMNTRRELFKDARVRQALGLALNFEWINDSLFHGQYTRNNSFFSNSYLAAEGVPEGLELSYLEPFRAELPEELFTKPLTPPAVKSPRDVRKNLLHAKKLLEQAGWSVKDGKLVNKEGTVFEFEILLVLQTFERVMAPFVKNLEKLGIKATYRTIDSALYVQRASQFDYDMIVMSYGQSQSPGNEQRNFWHSSSVDKPGSYNYSGISSPVVDSLVDRVIYANSQEELVAACGALDRVLWYGYYIIPNWYLPVHRIGFKNSLVQPDTLPLYYDPFQILMTWWMN